MQLTHFLAQFLGLFCIIVAIVMLVRKQAMLGIVMSLIQNPPLLFLVEILGLITGLAMVLGHSVWSKGVLAFIVTLVGWVALIRSTVLLFLPPEAIGRFLKTIRYEQNYYVFAAITLILGLYLTFAGFAG
jgi:putative exporter of polyketide antibiotics